MIKWLLQHECISLAAAAAAAKLAIAPPAVLFVYFWVFLGRLVTVVSCHCQPRGGWRVRILSHARRCLRIEVGWQFLAMRVWRGRDLYQSEKGPPCYNAVNLCRFPPPLRFQRWYIDSFCFAIFFGLPLFFLFFLRTYLLSRMWATLMRAKYDTLWDTFVYFLVKSEFHLETYVSGIEKCHLHISPLWYDTSGVL